MSLAVFDQINQANMYWRFTKIQLAEKTKHTSTKSIIFREMSASEDVITTSSKNTVGILGFGVDKVIACNLLLKPWSGVWSGVLSKLKRTGSLLPKSSLPCLTYNGKNNSHWNSFPQKWSWASGDAQICTSYVLTMYKFMTW